jgi:hypothetical protein
MDRSRLTTKGESNPMKSARWFVLVLVGVVLVTGCSAGGPSGAAEQWYEAVATGDGATALSLTCKEYQPQVQMAGFLTAGLGLLTGVDTGTAAADMSDLEFTTTSQDGDTATVHVEGEIIVSLLGAAVPEEVNSNLKFIREDGKWKMCGEY